MKTNQEARQIKLFNFFQNRLKTDLSIPAKYTQTLEVQGNLQTGDKEYDGGGDN